MKKTFFVSLAMSLLLGSVSLSDADTLNLMTVGSSGFINGAYFEQADVQPAGTGVIDPFLRIQDNGTEVGYNTNGTVVDDAKPGTWTHALLLTDVPSVTIVGTNYLQFLLDINQTRTPQSVTPLILDVLNLYLGDTDTLQYPNLGTLVYSLGNNTILLDYDLNPGSGTADMYAYIPTSYFGNSVNPWLYMYSGFSDSNDGFEEWAVIGQPSTNVPEPAMMLLFGTGLVGLVGVARKRNKK